MSDRTQIGPAIDADLWREFREDVRARKGQVRGVLGDELETAIRQYLNDSVDPVERKQLEKLTRIESALDIQTADGGVDTLEADSHTHAPSRLDVTEKPAANAATEKKVAYLARRAKDEYTLDPEKEGTVPKSVLRDLVKDEYGFRRDTAKRYVEELIDELSLQEHPDPNYDQLVTEPRYEAVISEELE